MDDRLAKWLSTYQHPTQQKRPARTRHDQASSYKELCKGRATELYKEKYFPHFQEPCLLVCAFKIFGVSYCVVPMFYSDVDKSIIQQCNAALSSFYLKFYLTAISVLLNRILNQTSSVKSWLKLL